MRQAGKTRPIHGTPEAEVFFCTIPFEIHPPAANTRQADAYVILHDRLDSPLAHRLGYMPRSGGSLNLG